MRTESTSSADAERTRESARPETTPRGKARTVVAPDDAKRFHALFQAGQQRSFQQQSAIDLTSPLATADEPLKFVAKEADAAVPADVSAMLQTQRVLLETPAAAVQNASPPPSAQLADLIEKHVKRMLVSEGASRGGRDGQVVLQLSDGLLSGTQLSLTRNGQGWRLQADAASSRSFDAIRDCAPELARRFAARGLGTIEIDPVLHR